MDPFAKLRGEFFGGVMREAGDDDVLKSAGLFGDCRGDAWIPVAVKIDPPGRDAIDDFATVRSVEKYAFGIGDADGGRIEEFVCKRVPDAKR